jgi:hypothetical protein
MEYLDKLFGLLTLVRDVAAGEGAAHAMVYVTTKEFGLDLP